MRATNEAPLQTPKKRATVAGEMSTETERTESDPDPIPLTAYAEEKTFDNASELLAFLGSEQFRLSRWVFRGQSNTDWPLQPSLERFANLIRERPQSVERYALAEFRRHAHHYTPVTPSDTLEWLALLRHHSAPSRLLDFTKSPYVAAFFATVEAASNQGAAIWAIDSLAIRRHAAILLSENWLGVNHAQLGKRCLSDENFTFGDPAVFDLLIQDGAQARIVVPVEPFRTNERMLQQRGMFLCQNTLFVPFDTALKNVVRHAKQDPETKTPVLFKLTITQGAHPYVLRELHRMNINYATLFPGLDGLALRCATVSKIRATTVPYSHRPDYEFEDVRY
jgi:hypothetical protein